MIVCPFLGLTLSPLSATIVGFNPFFAFTGNEMCVQAIDIETGLNIVSRQRNMSNFHPFELVGRISETQLLGGGKLNHLR